MHMCLIDKKLTHPKSTVFSTILLCMYLVYYGCVSHLATGHAVKNLLIN